MENTRQQKITRLIQKELSEIFRQQTAKTHGVLVSVSSVRISPDLSIAHAYLSIFPSGKGEEILANIKSVEGPILLQVCVKKGNRKDLGRPTTTPIQNKEALMAFLQK